MAAQLSAHSALDVTTAFTVYRIIGRRPSQVYVDENMAPTDDTSSASRLWDQVFEEMTAHPGDQIQDRGGSIMLVTRDGDTFPIRLSRPEARAVDTAFTHAARALAADRALADRMLLEGYLRLGTVRRLKGPPPPSPNGVFDEEHPLVVGGKQDTTL